MNRPADAAKRCRFRPATAARARRGQANCGVFALLALAAALLAGPGSAVFSAESAAPDPRQEVSSVISRALPILRDKATPVSQRRKRLLEIIEPNFDFRYMARSALGYHWRELSPAQRDEFAQLFTAFMENAYLSRINDYTGQEIAVDDATTQEPGRVKVVSRVLKEGAQPIRVDYLLRREGSDWKIYDVTVDAISIIANYRNQFNRVINNDGFDKLLSILRRKQQELRNSLAE